MTDKRLETARMFYYKASHDLRAVEKLLPDGPLDALLDICQGLTSAFETMRIPLESFFPYAVQLRYEWDFEPAVDEANRALEFARAIRELLLQELPELAYPRMPDKAAC